MAVPITLVQTISNSSSSASSTVTLAMADSTPGNLFVVATAASASTVSSVTDDAGNTYINVTSVNANNIQGSIWYARNIGGGAATITVTTATTCAKSACAREYSGVAPLGKFDQSATGSGVASVPTTAASLVTSFTQSLVIGACASTTSHPSAAGSGYTNFVQNTGQPTAVVSMEDKLITAPAAQTITFTGSSTFWSATGTTFAVRAVAPPFTRSLRPAIFKPGIAR